MYTKWQMAGLWKTSIRKLAVRSTLLAIAFSLSAGCSLLPKEEEQENVPQIRVPKISQKPEYPVKRGTLELKVSGSGKLMSEREDNLFFTADNRRVVEVYVKAGDQVKKDQILALLDTGDTESQIRRKEIDLEKAELDLKAALRDQSEDNSIQIRKQQLDYELLQEELAKLRKELEGAKLIAPYTGTILSFTAEKGDLAKAYEKIGRIADLNDLVVAVQFSSGDLSNIAVGMASIVSINTAGDHEGKVRRLPLQSTPSNNNQDSLDTYTLIDLAKPPEGVGHDTPLSASVIVERRENVPSIPLAALRKQNSRYYVIVSNADGSKGEVDVEIGVQTATDVEIIKGLEEGQKVVGK